MCLARGDVPLDEDLAAAERGAGLALGLFEPAGAARPAFWTTRIPRPPPPKLALMMTG